MAEDERRQRVIQKLRRELGPLVLDALDDPKTIEIMLNSDGILWVEKLGEPMRTVGLMTRANADAMLATLAAALDTTITAENPILEGELPVWGARFEGVSSPVSTFPCFAIRKKAVSVFTLDDYVKAGIMTEEERDVLLDAVKNRKNILVVGGTGTGKTTLTNALIDAIAKLTPDHRIIILEDTPEIQCSAENKVFLRSSARISMRMLLKVCMRMRPDRILIGETRGGEALDLLKAWNTGHSGGIATVHANSARAGLIRIEQLIAEASPSPMPKLIAEAVNVLVGIVKHQGSRRIEGIYKVLGYDNGEYVTEQIGTKSPSVLTNFPFQPATSTRIVQEEYPEAEEVRPRPHAVNEEG